MTDPRLRIMHGVCNYCYKSTPETQRGIDESIEDWQARRRGTGRDPKNRKRPCPHCSGTGRAQYCYVCGEKMLCGGREQPDPNVMYVMGFEPGPCLRAGRNTQPMYGGPESVMGGGVQKDMDAMVMGDLLGLVRLSTLGPAISLDETKKRRFATLDRPLNAKGDPVKPVVLVSDDGESAFLGTSGVVVSGVVSGEE